MNYSRRDILIGFVIIALIIIGVVFYKRNKVAKTNLTPTPAQITFEKELEDSFKYDIPDNASSIELKDISGGNGRGIATEKEILADIEDPASGYFYQGWLENNGVFISLGRLQMAKGGWLLEYDKSKYEEYKKLIISLEKINNSTIEKRILEGTFN
jgi:hypothetical protein